MHQRGKPDIRVTPKPDPEVELAIELALEAASSGQRSAWWRDGLDAALRAGAASPVDRARDRTRRE